MQTTAIVERPFSDTGHAVREDDFRQTTATSEGKPADTRHAVGDDDTRQTTATLERRIAYTRHRRSLITRRDGNFAPVIRFAARNAIRTIGVLFVDKGVEKYKENQRHDKAKYANAHKNKAHVIAIISVCEHPIEVAVPAQGDYHIDSVGKYSNTQEKPHPKDGFLNIFFG